MDAEREQVIARIRRSGIIAIVRGVAPDDLVPLAQALLAGGVELMELPLDQTHPDSFLQTAESIRRLTEVLGDRMDFGAGTVLTEAQAALTGDAGARFVLAPDTNEAVIRRARERGMVVIPGAMTPSEITAAHRAGADMVKLFPASSLGVTYIRAVSTPLAHIPLLAMGGITAENIAAYAAAGVVGFGIAGALIDRAAIARGDFGAITDRARRLVQALHPSV